MAPCLVEHANQQIEDVDCSHHGRVERSSPQHDHFYTFTNAKIHIVQSKGREGTLVPRVLPPLTSVSRVKNRFI